MAELEKLGTLDPAAQKKLLADLEQTDVSLWPLVIDQFRAAVAYRRQVAQRGTATPEAAATVSASDWKYPPTPLGQTASNQVDSSPAGAAASGNNVATDGNPLGATAGLSSSVFPSVLPSTSAQAGHHAGMVDGTLSQRARRPHAETLPPAGPPGPSPDGRVQQACYTAAGAAPVDVDGHLMAAIDALEAKSGDGHSEADMAQQARLRMLYLLAGRRDDALKPMPALPPAQQEFWNKQLYGLSTMMDAERTPDNMRRVAETKHVLDEAVADLARRPPWASATWRFAPRCKVSARSRPSKNTSSRPTRRCCSMPKWKTSPPSPRPRAITPV